MKGVVLAGGKGTRLYPLTHAVSKQLLPVYRNPMVFYPIMTLRDMGIKDILIITTVEQQELFAEALQHIKEVNLSFAVQKYPRGLPEALVIAQEWLKGSDVVMILGDNIIINNAPITYKPNSIFTFPVIYPERYGVVKMNNDRIEAIVEKPMQWVSNDAVIGLYMFTNDACDVAATLEPSARGELEIVDLIREMDRRHQMQVQKLDGFWFDAGNHDDLLDCANLIKAIEHRSTRKFTLS